MNLINIRQRFNTANGRRKQLEQTFDAKDERLQELKRKRDIYIKARWVLSEVAKITQESFKERVENLVTMAIRSVFNRDFTFELIFERKRNKLECQPIVLEGGNELIPKDDMGGSVLDIISFAFRVVLWSIEKPRSRNVLLTDEPGRWTGKLITLFGKMISEVSHRLGLQIIMPTHEEELMNIVDRVWNVEHDGTKSVVTLIGEEKAEIKLKKRRRKK